MIKAMEYQFAPEIEYVLDLRRFFPRFVIAPVAPILIEFSAEPKILAFLR